MTELIEEKNCKTCA